MSARSRYIIGIDLGTTNCAVACVERRKAAGGRVTTLPILQRVSETQVAERRTLPSFLYLPGEHELPEGALALPWQVDAEALVGDFARAQGARIPTRLVSSAKSWLCHPRADQTAPILPWDAPPGVPRVSPVEASARYLLHMREAWNHTHEPSDRFQDQEIVLAVPASFNEVARELTVQAARLAGLENVTLLEEPQAAFYSWLERQGDDPTRSLRGRRGILVCDIGGGTTDFTLIKVEQGASPADLPSLKRVAVGEHLMLGGDNMDLALAHVIEQALEARFDSRAWGLLTHACREAKERLLADGAPDEWTVVIPGSGSRLLGGMTRAPLERDDVHQIVLEGFFPEVGYTASPEQHKKALTGWGLPYASDAAVTRHLAAFLRQQGEITDPRDIPDLILFNGAALEPALLRDRIRNVLGSWSGQPPEELDNRELDLAVARGAAYYGWARENGGLRIGGGTARSYYVGISGPEAQAACLIPKGLEEGQSVEIREPAFHVVVDRPVAFPLFASSTRPHDVAGTTVALDDQDFESLPPLTTVLGTRRRSAARAGGVAPSTTEASDDLEGGTEVERPADEDEAPPPPSIPVHLRARVTEIGTLELWCMGSTTGQRWRLQFQVRGGELTGRSGVVPPGFSTVPTEDPRAVQRAQQLVVATYRLRAGRLDTSEIKPRNLPSAIEDLLRARRDDWSLGALRALWESLDRVQGRRRSTPEFEAPWLNFTGFTLRPGFGYPLDDWRINRTFDIFEGGLQHPKHGPTRIEWWVLWRRLAGGLDRLRQQQVFYEIAPHLLGGRKHLKTRLGSPASAAELHEMLRLAASLERLEPEQKIELGERAIARLQARSGSLDPWMLARLGTRQPLAASPHHCVPPDVAARWIELLLEMPTKERDTRNLGLAICQMGRVCDDRARDLAPGVRERAAHALEERGLPELARPLRELVLPEGELQAALVGESIPLGLMLTQAP